MGWRRGVVVGTIGVLLVGTLVAVFARSGGHRVLRIKAAEAPTFSTGLSTTTSEAIVVPASSSSTQPARSLPTTPNGPATLQCPAGQVRVSITADRAVYRPGDVVQVTATVSNLSARDCWVPTQEAGSGYCQPSVFIHGAFYDGVPAVGSPTYNGTIGPIYRSCAPTHLVVAAKRSVAVLVPVPFTTNGPEHYPTVYLHAGAWEVIAMWTQVTSQAATETIQCDPTVCKQPPTMTTSTTSSPTVAPTTTVSPVTTTTTTY